MHGNRSNKEGTACVISFGKKRKSRQRCCSDAQPNQRLIDSSPGMGKDILGSRIIHELDHLCNDQLAMLASTANNQYMLDYHLTSSTVSGASYTFSGEGTIEISKESLTKEIKKLILGKWAPEVRASNKVLKLTQLARLGIGCCQFLIFTDLKVAPESPHDKGTLSPVLAHVTIGLINALIEEIMHPVRNSHLELDPETRPGLVLWYIYLSRSLFPNLSNATRCQLYDNPEGELFQHVKKILWLFLQELKQRFAADCKNKAFWAAGFASQRAIVKGIHLMERWSVLLKMILYDDIGREINGNFFNRSSGEYTSGAQKTSVIAISREPPLGDQFYNEQPLIHDSVDHRERQPSVGDQMGDPLFDSVAADFTIMSGDSLSNDPFRMGNAGFLNESQSAVYPFAGAAADLTVGLNSDYWPVPTTSLTSVSGMTGGVYTFHDICSRCHESLS